MEFKQIRDSQYIIFEDGSIQNTKNCRFMKTANVLGYRLFKYQRNKKDINCYVHRLVAEAFIPNPENKAEVNHKDFDRGNNHVSNLEWTTPAENRKHAQEGGRIKSGERAYNACLTNKEVNHSRWLYKNGWDVDYIAKKYNVSKSTIRGAIEGKTYAIVGNAVKINKVYKLTTILNYLEAGTIKKGLAKKMIEDLIREKIRVNKLNK